MECTPEAVRAGAKFEETREVLEEPLTMPCLSVDIGTFMTSAHGLARNQINDVGAWELELGEALKVNR